MSSWTKTLFTKAEYDEFVRHPIIPSRDPLWVEPPDNYFQPFDRGQEQTRMGTVAAYLTLTGLLLLALLLGVAIGLRFR